MWNYNFNSQLTEQRTRFCIETKELLKYRSDRRWKKWQFSFAEDLASDWVIFVDSTWIEWQFRIERAILSYQYYPVQSTVLGWHDEKLPGHRGGKRVQGLIDSVRVWRTTVWYDVISSRAWVVVGTCCHHCFTHSPLLTLFFIHGFSQGHLHIAVVNLLIWKCKMNALSDITYMYALLSGVGVISLHHGPPPRGQGICVFPLNPVMPCRLVLIWPTLDRLMKWAAIWL